MRVKLGPMLSVATATAIAGLSVSGTLRAERESAIPQDPSRYMIVDCLLPGTIRVVGGRTYLTKQRPVNTSASDCAIRGGDYVTYDRANYQTALSVWLPQAESGDAEAQAHVGEIFEKGLGRPADYGEAARWYEKAAAQDYARAKVNLAYLYEQGLGVATDRLKALNLYREASGIKDDSLAYASEVTEKQKTIDDLTAQLEQQNTEIDRLKSDVDSGQSQIASQQNALARARTDADQLRVEVSRLRSQPVADPEQLAALQRLESDLRARELKLLEQERTVTGLESTAAEQNARLAEQLDAAARKDRDLRTQLQETAEARDELQRKFDETRLQLLGTEQRAARLNADLAKARAQIASERESLARRPATSTPIDQAERQSRTAELAERERRLAAQQAQIASLQKEKDGYLAELRRLRTEQQARGATLGPQQAELAASRQRLAETEKQVAVLAAQLEMERARAEAQRLQLTQRSSSISAAEQKRRQELAASLAARERVIEQQQRQIASLRAQQQTQAQLVGQQAQQRTVIANVRQELAETKRELVESKQRVTKLTGELETARSEITANIGQITRSASQEESSRLRAELVIREEELVERQAQITWLESQNRIYIEKIAGLQKFPVTPTPPVAPPKQDGVLPLDLPKDLQSRKFYALIIGNEEYEDSEMQDLQTAMSDARAVQQVLRDKYKFITELLPNAKQGDILDALQKYRETLKPNDSLLIYYAGHGEIREFPGGTKESYWLPTDARPNKESGWIDATQLARQINVMPAKHILIVADSCYQGLMTRPSSVRFKALAGKAAQITMVTQFANSPSRTVLTSGGEKPVLDSGGGQHSVFAAVFLRVLQQNDKVLVGAALHDALFQKVRDDAKKENLDQSPQYNVLADAGHVTGEFLFIPKS